MESRMNLDPTASQLAAAGVAYAPQIAAAAQRHAVDPQLLAAVAAQETGGPGSNAGRNVVGDGGHGHGLFQIDDRWHAFASTAKAMDPAANADYAAGMLHELIGRYGNVRQALSAYNAGSPDATGTKTAWPDGKRLGYADSVMRHYAEIGGAEAGPAPSGRSASPAVPPPPMPAPPQFQAPAQPQTYRRQETDYTGLFDSDDSPNADDSTTV
jgi:soluble lytic murein transglycosylase-like protein